MDPKSFLMVRGINKLGIHLYGGRSDHFPGSTQHFSHIFGQIWSLSEDGALMTSAKL